MTFEEINDAIARMGRESDLAPLLAPGAPALVFAAAPLRLLWASNSVTELAGALVVAPDGRIDPSFPAARRIEALARSEAPAHGKRFEKIRFETSALAPLTTCAFRRIGMPDGSAALLVAFIDRIPQIRRPGRSPATPPPAAQPAVAEPAEPAAAPESPPVAAPVTGPVRFLWECDTRGVITRISGDLESAVGAQHAGLVGRDLAGILDMRSPDALACDPKQIVLELIARRETFSGRRIFWKAQGGAAIAVDFAGFPAPGAAGRQGGYRGFGIARPEISLDWTSLHVPDPEPAVPAEPDHAPAFADPVLAGPAAAVSPLASLVPEAGAPVGEAIPTGSLAESLAEPSAETTSVSVAESAPVDPVPVEASVSVVAQDAVQCAALPDNTPLPSGAHMLMTGLSTRISGRLGDVAPPLRIVADADAVRIPENDEGSIDTPGQGGKAEQEQLPAMPDAESGSAIAQPEDEQELATPSDQESRPAPLSMEERNAFREIAKALGARFSGEEQEAGGANEDVAQIAEPAPSGDDSPASGSLPAGNGAQGSAAAPVIIAAANDRAPDIRAVLDRLPAGVVVHRGEDALFVNRYLLDLLGYADLTAFTEAGGLARLFQARPAALTETAHESTAPLIIANSSGESVAVEVRLTTIDWLGYPASMLMLRKIAETDPMERLRALESDLAAREERLREQTAILDTAMDGVVLLDQGGRILSLNRAAEALFGYDQREIAGESLTQLLETESRVSALEYLAAMRENGMRSVLNDGCEVLGRVRQGGAIPLFMTLGSVGEGLDRKFCAVLRDMTAFKQTENELIAARRAAEAASAQKSEFLARISHEVRTPLNAIIGFAEVMLDERFGPVGNERYRDYLTDIHASGEHVISLVNDLLDLAKIEAGRMELNFIPVALNDLVNAGVAMMQPEAARERIVLRTSFADRLPPVLVDERAMRQIVINLLSNAVKFTDAGGQVIVSTARGPQGDVILRVRDTGIGMNEGEIAAALEPFRQLATTRKAGGTGLGLPLTKALVEANEGSLRITSRKDEGTLAEVVFPPARVVAG